AHLVVEVRVGAPAGRADGGDDVALVHLLSGADLDRVAVAVDGDEAVVVVDGDDVAEAPPGHALAQRIAAGEADDAVGAREDGRAGGGGEVEAFVEVGGAGE